MSLTMPDLPFWNINAYGCFVPSMQRNSCCGQSCLPALKVEREIQQAVIGREGSMHGEEAQLNGRICSADDMGAFAGCLRKMILWDIII
jgi:hypothetical protein